MPEDSGSERPWRAPYVSYETFSNFFDRKLAGQIVPPRIDSHFLDNYAGSVRPLMMSALKTMGMIDENGTCLDPIRQAAADSDARRSVMRDWAADFYRDQTIIAEQGGTASMLWETFAGRGYSGSTMRKAVVFYLSVADDVGLPLSPHFKPPKNQSSVGSKAAKRRTVVKPTIEPASVAAAPPAPAEACETKHINLGGPGDVTIIVRVRWLDLDDERFIGLRRAIREIESYGTGDDEDDLKQAS